MENETKTICLNCGTEFCGKYCPKCGQSFDVHRFSWKDLLSNITRGIFNTDKGFIFTLLHLFYKPGIVMKEYIEGKRKKYFSPFPMMFIIIALYMLFRQIYEALYGKIINIGNTDTNVTMPNWMRFVFDFFSENIGLVMLLVMPFLVIALRICFGHKFRSSYNNAEVFIMTGYMNAQIFVILSLFTIVSLFFPSLLNNQGAVVFFSYIGLMFWNLMPISGFKTFKNIRRSFLCYILFIALIILTIIIIVMIIALLLPDTKFN